MRNINGITANLDSMIPTLDSVSTPGDYSWSLAGRWTWSNDDSFEHFENVCEFCQTAVYRVEAGFGYTIEFKIPLIKEESCCDYFDCMCGNELEWILDEKIVEAEIACCVATLKDLSGRLDHISSTLRLIDVEAHVTHGAVAKVNLSFYSEM